MNFQSSQLSVHVTFAVYPLQSSFLITNRSLAGLGRGTVESWPDSSEDRHRRRGKSGRKVRVRRGLPDRAFGWGWGGR